ncbi:MAG: type II secretion system protein [Maricaulis sp.]|nr:type II secretion system protein [Maricaulis sp.]
MTQIKARRLDKEAGFTVVESLMAMVVAASIGIAMVFALGSARQNAREAHVRQLAMRVADNLMIEALGEAPLSLVTSGPVTPNQPDDLEPLMWQRSVTPQGNDNALYRIDVVVPWRVGLKDGQVSRVEYRWGDG